MKHWILTLNPDESMPMLLYVVIINALLFSSYVVVNELVQNLLLLMPANIYSMMMVKSKLIPLVRISNYCKSTKLWYRTKSSSIMLLPSTSIFAQIIFRSIIEDEYFFLHAKIRDIQWIWLPALLCAHNRSAKDC